ncbi:hypothetical protein HQ545_06750 [Candidatus Woesearchaeota archaeon]|nr:hypothetical protein [Candidatus Woesearchaeota archaeon]
MVDVINATINATINTTANQTAQFDLFTFFSDNLMPRVFGLLKSPVEHPDMLWTLAPMIIALLLMQFYFGRNKDEALGWNTAFGNSIALIFISVSLLRGLFIISGEDSVSGFLVSLFVLRDIKIILIAAVFSYGIFLSMISFFHWIPERLAFFMMNGISINVTAFVAIVLVNSDDIPLDFNTILAGMLIFILVYLLSLVIRYFVPASIHARIRMLEQKRHMIHSKESYCKQKAFTSKSKGRRERMRDKSRKFLTEISEINENLRRLRAQL